MAASQVEIGTAATSPMLATRTLTISTAIASLFGDRAEALTRQREQDQQRQ